MKTKISRDPLNIFSTIKPIVDDLKYININEKKLEDLCIIVNKRIKAGLPVRDIEFFTLDNYSDDIQVVFLENVVNFCFWAEKGEEKWKAEYNKIEDDGSAALRIVFERAINEKIPILDASFLEKLTLEDTKKLFRSSNQIEIPLIKERHKNLVEAGKNLNKYFNGKYLNLIIKSNYDAIEITKNTIKYFKSFNDSYDGVNYYKRAQLNAFDIAQIQNKNKISNTEKLTAMADYKLPQLLRYFGVLEYLQELVSKVDNYELIKYGSREETEIRTSTIWVIDQVSKKLNISAGLADRAIWWLSRELNIKQPYHRTFSIYY